MSTSAEDWSQATEFAAEPRSVASARRFVTSQLLSHDMRNLVGDVQLVVSELATNAVVHAETPYMVILQAVGDSVRLEVLDGSRDAPVLTRAASLDLGGRGVAVVDTVSRSWGVGTTAAGGKSVWAEFDRPR